MVQTTSMMIDLGVLALNTTPSSFAAFTNAPSSERVHIILIIPHNTHVSTVSHTTHTQVIEGTLQWNLSNSDTNGAEESVLLARCPHYNMQE